MNPYTTTSAVLTTYSGKKIAVEIESEVFREPLRKVKERLLDGFIAMCKESADPFVGIEVKTKALFV